MTDSSPRTPAITRDVLDQCAEHVRQERHEPLMLVGAGHARACAEHLAVAFPDLAAKDIGAVILGTAALLGTAVPDLACQNLVIFLNVLAQTGEQLYSQPDPDQWAASLGEH